MGWFEDLDKSIDSIITSHKCPKKSETHPQTTAEELRGLFNNLSVKVATGSDAQNSYAAVDVHLTHREIAWLTKNPLLAKSALLLSAAGNSGKTSTVSFDNNTKVMKLSISA